MFEYENEVKNIRIRLKQLETKDPKIVYHCPVCNKDVIKYQYNLEKQGRCNNCERRKEWEDMQTQANTLIGATILEVDVKEPSEYLSLCSSAHDHAHITNMKVQLKNGKIVKLQKVERPMMRM